MSARAGHVLRVGSRARSWMLALAALAGSSCGYRPAADVMRLHSICVRGGPVRVADPGAVASMESGARQALAREGRLGDCSRDPQLVIALIELRDVPEGVMLEGDRVASRGARTVATAQAKLVSAGGTSELGMIAAGVTYAHGGVVASEVGVRADARATAAWRAGEGMARRAMGQPSASDPRPASLGIR